jgi:uncharacterized phage protein gp47/JayE
VGVEGGELMPFSRPALADLRGQAQSDLAAKLPGADPLLRFANLRIFADMTAEMLNGGYGYLDWIWKQATPFTATAEALEGWAALKGVTRKPASVATGTASAAGGGAGATIPAGTVFARGDGAQYATTAEVAVAGDGTVTVQLAAVSPEWEGSAGTLETGTALAIGQAIAGVPNAWTATAGAPGVDVESDDALRTRMLGVYAAPPQGGARSDYEEWALQVAGVSRAWCVPNGQGAGTAVVYFMMDEAESAHGGFPQGTNGVASGEARDTVATGDQLTVANHIYPLQPVTALVYAYAPDQNVVAFTLSLPGASADLKTRIGAAIDQVFLEDGAPGGVVDLSAIESAIAVLPGAAGFVITAESCTHGVITPAGGNIVSDAGHLPVRGVLTWT